MAVPFIDLQRFEEGFLDRWAEKCHEITRNTRFISGPEATKLEGWMRDESGVAEVVACANGTDALQLALRALGVGEGDLVLIPDATFWATFEAVVNVGARPVTVDIDLEDLQMDFDLFTKAVEQYKPKASILVNLYGWGTRRLDDFRAFCRKRNLPLLEDSAQAYGTTWKGASIYRDALISTVSFYPAKVLGSCGDAGAVYCGTKELADTVRKLSNHGRTSHYGYGLVGWNSRIGGFDAAFLKQVPAAQMKAIGKDFFGRTGALVELQLAQRKGEYSGVYDMILEKDQVVPLTITVSEKAPHSINVSSISGPHDLAAV